MFVHRLLDAPKNQLKAIAFGSLIVAQAVTGTTLALHDGGTGDGIVQLAAGEASKSVIAPESFSKISAQQLLDLAERQVGISENASGGGTKFHAWYMGTPRAEETVTRDTGTIAGYANAAWCDMFVSWVGTQLGLQDTVGTDAYTVAHAKWFAAQSRWGSTPTPGAVVFFAWNGSKDITDIDHVGFVVQDNGDGTIETVEGNTGNGKVEIRTRPTYQVAGYGYPSYAVA